VIRLLILVFGVLWGAAAVARFSRRIGRGSVRPIRGARPASPPPATGDRLIGLLRTVLAVLFVIAFAGALFAFTGLPDVVVVLVTAPVAGLASALLTEWFVTEED
jgi:hypothetical protein